MKIVLSRKGFDSSYGRVPSPILPDGTAVPLPVPVRRSPMRFRDVRWRHGSLGALVEDLSGGRIRRDYRCHLDPDLEVCMLSRQPGWRPAFGQVDIAQRHLERENVGPGDLFLFFGWFQPADKVAGRWRYVRGARSVHRLFGWLQVSEVVSAGSDTAAVRKTRPWLCDHPHANGQSWPPNNTIYIAARTLSIDGNTMRASGGGLFSGAGARLTLTAPGATGRSHWRLPAWFYPGDRPPSLSYHRNEQRWRRAGSWAYVDTVGRGQEFVFDAAGVPEARVWLHDLFQPLRASRQVEIRRTYEAILVQNDP